MAFTRRYLTALGIEAEKIEEIMAAHVEVTEALKAQIADSKEEADELAKAKDEIAKLKSSQKEMAEKLKAAETERDDFKGKYDTAAADIEKMKSDNEARETTAKREDAIRSAAKAKKLSDEAISIILDSKKDYASRIEFGDDGKAKNVDDVFKEIFADRPSLSESNRKVNHTPDNPPANSGGKAPALTWDEIDNITDAGERQAAMAQNMEALGIK